MDKWISVETPPEKKGYYLVWDINFGSEQPMDVLFYQPYNQSWYYKADTFHPTHWQPLPSAPGEDKSEGEDELWQAVGKIVMDGYDFSDQESVTAKLKQSFSIKRKQ
jgi:hypothetical protein